MKFKEFLRRVIGGRLHGDRLHIFRKYCYELVIATENIGHIPPEEKTEDHRLKKVSEAVERFTRDGVDQVRFYHFSTSIPAWRQGNRIEQRRNAANKRWQTKSKKPLGGG